MCVHDTYIQQYKRRLHRGQKSVENIFWYGAYLTK